MSAMPVHSAKCQKALMKVTLSKGVKYTKSGIFYIGTLTSACSWHLVE